MERPCNAEAGDEDAKSWAKLRNRPALRRTLDNPHLRGIPACIDSSKNHPSASCSSVDIVIVIVGICCVCVHPREFLFFSSYRFVCRPISALADDAVEPFAGDLQEGRARQSAGYGTTGTDASDQGDLL